MAIYRTISMSFWTDSKVVDDFTPEDRYFYLYLFTNPHTNLCGCYEISIRQMAYELGYAKESVENLIRRFETVHKVLRYSPVSKEVLLLNWHKYNWTKSEKFRVPLIKEIEQVKDTAFKNYLCEKAEIDPYRYGIDINCIDITDTVTVTDTDTVSGTDTDTISESDVDAAIKAVREKKNAKKEKQVYYENPELNDLFYEYLDIRKKVKAVNSERAINNLLKKIHEYSCGDEQVAMELINNSITNSWKDIYPLKGQKTKGNSYLDAIANRVNIVDTFGTDGKEATPWG